MMNPKTQTIVASSIITLTAIVAIALIPMKPDGSAVVLAGIGGFIVVWNTMKFFTKRKCDDWINSKTRHEILFAIILASLLLLGAISATLAKELGIFESDLVERILGVNIGLMLIVLGNYMPKKNQAGASECVCISKPISGNLQRFLGWTFVLGGLLYSLAWITLDLDQAGIAIMFSFPAAIAIVLVTRVVYLRFSGQKPIAEQS